jgi:hypothetical protein
MAGERKVQEILYRLECGEVARAAETLVSGKLHCGKHGKMEEIASVVTNEWRAKCYTCRFARWAGLSQDTAKIFANGHNARNRGHSAQDQFAANPAAEKTAAKLTEYSGKHRVTA